MIDRASPIPIYYQIKTHLAAQIESGELAKGEKLPSELELAKRNDISPMTVRQAYNELVAADLVVRLQGRGTFVSSHAPAEPESKKCGVDVGVLIPSLTDAGLFQTELLNGIESKAHSLSYHTHLLSSNSKPLQDPRNYILHTMLDKRQIDGVIAIGVFGSDDRKYLEERDIPFVFVDNDFSKESIHTVLLDDEGYVYTWAKHLFSKGVERVGLLCGERSKSLPKIRRRADRMIAGLERAYEEAGLASKKSWICPNTGGSEKTREATAQKFLRARNRPDAVIVHGDAMTHALIKIAQQDGVSIPEDLLTINYGDTNHSPYCYVPKPLQDMGGNAVELLRKLIKKSSSSPDRIVLPLDEKAILSANWEHPVALTD
ncbi:GntR family transcriptional regulator [Kiritimatiellaeota bacterium B1221]|nr:GntR family transcriptional regulator [Kiritimatiellaeota bacterium B1221]